MHGRRSVWVYPERGAWRVVISKQNIKSLPNPIYQDSRFWTCSVGEDAFVAAKRGLPGYTHACKVLALEIAVMYSEAVTA